MENSNSNCRGRYFRDSLYTPSSESFYLSLFHMSILSEPGLAVGGALAAFGPVPNGRPLLNIATLRFASLHLDPLLFGVS